MPGMQNELTEQAKQFSIPHRILLVEEIWDTIADENQAFDLTDGQKRELDRRLESPRSNPDQGRTWDQIKAEFMSRTNPSSRNRGAKNGDREGTHS